MTEREERAAFEAWARDKWWYRPPWAQAYVVESRAAWRASRALALEQAAQACEQRRFERAPEEWSLDCEVCAAAIRALAAKDAP